MQRHTSELYRLAELPAFIEEALGNASLKDVIAAQVEGSSLALYAAMCVLVQSYAETWVDDWMSRNQPNLWADKEDEQDQEIRAIEAGVKLYSNPDCKAGLPE